MANNYAGANLRKKQKRHKKNIETQMAAADRKEAAAKSPKKAKPKAAKAAKPAKA